jgi:hypothetical protein
MSAAAKASTPFAAANNSVLTRSVISPDCSPKVSVRQADREHRDGQQDE